MAYVRGPKRRGLRGYQAGNFPIPVYAFRGMGCTCAPKRLGDDVYTGLNPDGSVDTSWIPPENMPNAITSINPVSNPNPFYLPGLMTGPILPSTPASATNPNLYSVPGSAPGTVYNASLQTSVPTSGVLGAAGLGGLSVTTILAGGAALFLVTMLARRRR